jgi:hypothetical protein
MEDIKVKTSGRPRTRPLEVLADAAYDDLDIRKYLRFRVIKSNIPSILVHRFQITCIFISYYDPTWNPVFSFNFIFPHKYHRHLIE